MRTEKNVEVTITADTSAFMAAMRCVAEALNSFGRKILGWDHPDNPYRHWPACAEDHEIVFLGTEGGLDRPCPGCGAAL